MSVSQFLDNRSADFNKAWQFGNSDSSALFPVVLIIRTAVIWSRKWRPNGHPIVSPTHHDVNTSVDFRENSLSLQLQNLPAGCSWQSSNRILFLLSCWFQLKPIVLHYRMACGDWLIHLQRLHRISCSTDLWHTHFYKGSLVMLSVSIPSVYPTTYKRGLELGLGGWHNLALEFRPDGDR